MKILILLFFALIISGCNLTDSDQNEINQNDLQKTWVNSWEEQVDSVKIFRPENFMEFPTVRFRAIYKFKSNNNLTYRVLAPNDAHYYSEGKWNLQNEILSLYDTDDVIFEKYKIVELKNDILKMIRIIE